MMDQKVEDEKERRKGRNQRLIMTFFIGLFLMNIQLMMILSPFSKETELKGKFIFLCAESWISSSVSIQ